MLRTMLVVLGVSIGAAAACSDPTVPIDDFELPAPDASLDADRLAVGEYLATPCDFGKFGDGLVDLRDRHEWVLVDVFFGRMSETAPMDRVTEADLEVIRDREGRILHVFDLPGVRARILLSRVRDLVSLDRQREGHWITIRDVPDATRYDVEVSVGFRRPLGDADIAWIEELGGRVTHHVDLVSGQSLLTALLPDRSIAELRAHPDVWYVEVPGVGCVA